MEEVEGYEISIMDFERILISSVFINRGNI